MARLPPRGKVAPGQLGLGGAAREGDPAADQAAADPGSSAAGAAPGATTERTLVFVCHGPSCSERGSPALFDALRVALDRRSTSGRARLCRTSCLDSCATGPNVVLGQAGRIQTGLLPARAEELAGMLEQSTPGDGGEA